VKRMKYYPVPRGERGRKKGGGKKEKGAYQERKMQGHLFARGEEERRAIETREGRTRTGQIPMITASGKSQGPQREGHEAKEKQGNLTRKRGGDQPL